MKGILKGIQKGEKQNGKCKRSSILSIAVLIIFIMGMTFLSAENVHAKEVEIDISKNEEVNIYSGSVKKLIASVNVYNPEKKWKTSDKNIVTVDKEGNIRAVKAGKAYITISVGSVSRKIPVRVYDNNWEPEISNISVCVGRSTYVDITSKKNEELKKIYWSWPNGEKYRDLAYVTLNRKNKSCFRLNIDGRYKGNDRITISFKANKYGKIIEWRRNINVNVTKRRIKQDDFCLAKGVKKQLEVDNWDKSTKVKSVKWRSKNKEVAVVNSKGVVCGKKRGTARIYADMTLENGNVEHYFTEVCITDPKLKSNVLSTNIYGNFGYFTSNSIVVKGISENSKITYKSNKPSSVSISKEGWISIKKAGITYITVNVDGKNLKYKVLVSKPSFDKDYDIFSYGKTTWMKIKGVAKGTKISYSSSNTKVAKVDARGKIYILGYGEAVIRAKINSYTIEYMVGCAPERALNACKNGEYIYKTCTYSQDKRMSDGYYDCSALVFKSYDRDAGLLGGSYDWAPTAAGMAEYMEKTGKVISYQRLAEEDMRPGDLAFIGGEDNGRYKGIYHVEMYYGEKFSRIFGDVVMVARPVPN